MRGKAVTNRKSPAAVMRNPSAARGIILKCCVAVMAIPQGKYKSGALTKAKIAVQPPQDVFENNRPSSHAIGSTMTEMNGTSKNRFINVVGREPLPYLMIDAFNIF